MKLYYSTGACSFSPHVVMRELGIPVELVRYDADTRTLESGADFSTINPKMYVPALELEDGQVLTEGPAIVQYLADRKPEAGLAPPNGTVERYRLQEMLGYINSEIHKAYSPLFHASTPAETRADRVAYLTKRYALVDRWLGGKEYLLGGRFGVADAYLYTVTRWARAVKLDLTAFANVKAFMDRVGERPSVQAALAAERAGKKHV
ncbi:MAG: glutathione transferase GstA [Polyangiaceae bacterium]